MKNLIHRCGIFYKIGALFLFLTILSSSAPAQQNINFTRLNSNDGMSSNTVSSIIKDRFGLMWFATDDGLNKFDGTSFTVYRNRPKDSTSLPANEIKSLHEDAAGRLWVGTSGGSLCLYNREQDNFSRFPAGNRPNAIRNNVVLGVCSDNKGNIWIGNYGGVNILDPKTNHVTDFSLDGKKRFEEATTCLFKDSQSRLWIGTMEGLTMYDPASGALRSYRNEPADAASLAGAIVMAIAEDKQGRIYAGTAKGLSVLNPATGRFTNYTHHPNTANSISKGQVLSMAIDSRGLVWIGTASGLDIMDPARGKIDNISFDNRNVQGLAARSIQAIYIDRQGILWIGSFRGGVSKYDQNLSLFNLIQSNPFDERSLPAPIVTSFAETENGKIFVGTEYGGVALFDKSSKTFKRLDIRSQINQSKDGLVVLSLKLTRGNKLLIGTYADGLFILDPVSGSYKQMLAGNSHQQLSSNEIFSVAEDKAGNIWLGTNGEGITVLDKNFEVINRYLPNPRFPGDVKLPINGYIRDIIQDHTGNFWIATHGGGIAMLNPAINEFRIFNEESNNLPDDKVQSIFEDRGGNIWVGTYGGGLGVLNQESQRFTSYLEEQGLLNNTIYAVVEDATGKLWLSTNKGLSSFDIKTRKFSNYTFHNGLQPNNFVHGAGLLASDGTMYFGGIEGFNYFKPEFLNRNTQVPKILFTELKVSNQLVTPSPDGPIKENISVTKQIDLDFKQNFAISFVGLNYTASQQNQYAYKLEGFDKDWNYAGNVNSASYTNLDPGEYTFHVRASNNDGVWNNEGNSIRITVHPPFWRTTYAYVFYILLIIGILAYSRHIGLQRVKRKFQAKQEKMRLDQERRETERVRELDQQKIRFLTNLSHEFRTPISLILGPIDSLIHHENSDQSFGQLHLIKRNARRLLNLVNQLLDFRKMEEDELSLHPSRGEFISFVREVTDSFKDLAERKKIALVFDNHLHSFHTSFDHDKMERILFNLLSNAFKFTLEGGRIGLSIEPVTGPPDSDKQWLQIKVSDTGIGIPADKLEKIFETFFQHKTAPEILNQGTGIGLSITKEFVEMQGGSIHVESDAGKGACFIMLLPFEAIDITGIETEEALNGDLATRPEQTQKNIANQQTEETSVLLVEDNDDFRYYLKDILSPNYKVLEATNGKEGWQKALAQHPQLIVSDISMPYMDGIELCKKIKADKRTNHIPVILLTALIGEEHQLRGLEIGANDYITKPFNFDMLNAKVKNLLELNNNFKNTYTKQIKVLTPEIEVESEDEKLMSGIMAYLEENLTDTQLSVEGLSKHVGMSRSSLYNKLLELTGQTPVEFIRSVKLDKSAALLEKSDMNIAQIAYSVGFATPNYFAKSFKAKFGMLPSEYLSMKRGK